MKPLTHTDGLGKSESNWSAAYALIIRLSKKEIGTLTGITDIVPGEFPVDAWRPILLEIPDGGSKKHTGGRFPYLPGSSSNGGVKWDASRIISLPVYKNTEKFDLETLRGVRVRNDFPDAVPTVTLANRIDGCYCDQRRAQTVSVLPVWADGTSMLLELDWYEGPLEDCSNPEWHMRASPRISLQDGLDRLRRICRIRPVWEDCSFYVYVIPPFLGSNLLGRGNGNSNKVWQKEWRYSNHGDMLSALGKIVTTIMELGIGDTN